jgi:hypothetical protein
MEPLIAFRHRVDELRRLRPDPLRLRGHIDLYNTIGSIKNARLLFGITAAGDPAMG